MYVMNEAQLIELTEIAERGKSNTHQIDEIKSEIRDMKIENKALYELTTSVKLIAQDMSSIKQDITEVKCGQEKLSVKMDSEISKVKDEQEKIKYNISEVKFCPTTEKAKSFDKIKWIIISIITTAIITGIISNLIHQ